MTDWMTSSALANRSEHVHRRGCALRGVGFSAHEVKAAIDATRTHVGTAELPLEHWLRIALSYFATDWMTSSVGERSEHVRHTIWDGLRRGRLLGTCERAAGPTRAG